MESTLVSLQTPGEVSHTLAGRSKALRLAKQWTRDTLAARAGVSSASLKRFESTGAASLELVLRLAFALGRLEDFAQVLEPAGAATLAELKQRSDRSDRPARKRGRL